MNEAPRILVVDDELSIRESFKLILSDKYQVITAASGEAAVKHAADNNIDLTFLDIRMPGMDGLETLKRLREVKPDLMVIMITAVNDVQNASKAIRLGAQDYIVKPFDVDQVLMLAHDVILKKGILEESRKAGRMSEPSALIGSSDAVENIRKNAAEAASKAGGVLIIGPAGVEREAVAKLLMPEVRIDLRDQNISLFGKSSGSTVADIKKIEGAVEEGATASIFIDHAERLPQWAQEKLAEYQGRVFLGATVNLKEIGFNGRLYEKCSETIIEVPPLLQRVSDIPQLLEYHLNEANLRYFKEIKGFSQEASNILSSYPWPGNAEQLQAVAANMVLLSGDRQLLEIEDIPLDVLMNETSFSPVPLEDAYAKLEKAHISDVLKETGQDREAAARILGISENVLSIKA